jgi:uncharacterized protein YkwD
MATGSRRLCLGCLLIVGCAADGSNTDHPRAAAGASGQVGVAGASASVPAGAGSRGTAVGAAGAPVSNVQPGTAGVGAPGMQLSGNMPRAGAAAPTAGASASSAGGATGGTTNTSVTDPSNCPAPPADATPESITALNAVNMLRVAAGSGCATLNTIVAKAAASHCAYYATNNASDAMCTSNPHLEVSGCTGYTGDAPWDRMKAAGFMSNGGGAEVMAFVDNPEGAVSTWVNSVWHRIPILDPGTTVLGYGDSSGTACDTMDFGPGMKTPTTTVVVYPYDGQTGIPVSFNGQYEGPMPPAPTTGWPSSDPITVYAQKIVVTEHTLMIDGTTDPIDHVWLDSTSTQLDASSQQELKNVVFMYASKPFVAMTKYRVKVSGTFAGGTLSKEWTFTTGAAAPMRGGRM